MINPDGTTGCRMDWCVSAHVIPGGIYPSKINSCGERKRSTLGLYVTGADCINMGGSPDFAVSEWGNCPLDYCEATMTEETV